MQQHGDVVAARHWFRITAIMQKIGLGAIEGCKKIWGIARRLWLKKPPVGDSLEAVLKASAGLSWQRHELAGAVLAECERQAVRLRRATRARKLLEFTRPELPKGWAAGWKTADLLQWQAKRDFIGQMKGRGGRASESTCGGNSGGQERATQAGNEKAESPSGQGSTSELTC